MYEKLRRGRGRPRAYDADRARRRRWSVLGRRLRGDSLDDLSAATGMNRPSLYAAFGDKQAIYMKAIDRYRAGPALNDALAGDRTLRESLQKAYQAALSVYLSGEQGARRYFVIGTAAAEAVGNPMVRAELAGVLHDVDQAFEARIAWPESTASCRTAPTRRPGDDRLGRAAKPRDKVARRREPSRARSGGGR